MEFGQSTTRIAITVDTVFASALTIEATRKGLDMSELVQQIVEKHVIENKMIDAKDVMRKQLMESLVERAVKKARMLCRNGEFGPDLTGRTLLLCMADDQWASDYEKYLMGANPYRHGNPLKGRINIELGWAIKNGVGAQVAVGENNKPKKVYVNDNIIQSFTALMSFDPKKVMD